ncbi:TlpA family protein disulfide reductase [Dermabacter vaginalis]|uniref:TlpA family protein disulfide reductase n=1 Tax=Dermabacter vaginalis TaxID=1630135 RepID=UPI0021A51F13|nr:TlpA disulfide reductase family protein [Dermabacter vaginalis]MCT2150394.1 TlpA family protein disulfide reductase [Dermabacter vaginalis]
MSRSFVTRRAALALPLGVLGLAGCASTDTSERYDTGYVEGSGVSTEVSVEKRGDAYDFTGETFDGETFTLSEKRGAPVVLNVWYASCAPCRKEAPDLVKLHEKYAGEGVEFIGINVRDEAGPAQAFEKKFSIPYPSIPDRDGAILYALRGQVSPNAVPSTLVFDKQGRVAARISGLADPSILSAMIDRVLAE